MVIGGYNPFHNYFCPPYSCFYFFLLSTDPEIFVEIAWWPRFEYFEYEISRALVSCWHPPKLLLPTRLHSNTSFCLLSFFYLLETLELHLVARRLSPGVPSRGTPLVMESSTSTPTSVCQRTCDVLHLLYYFLYLL